MYHPHWGLASPSDVVEVCELQGLVGIAMPSCALSRPFGRCRSSVFNSLSMLAFPRTDIERVKADCTLFTLDADLDSTLCSFYHASGEREENWLGHMV